MTRPKDLHGEWHAVPQGQALEVLVDLDWGTWQRAATDIEQAGPLIVTTIQRSGDVRLRDLDAGGRRQFANAKNAEVKSWLRCEAVRVALHNRFNASGVMTMRGVLL